MAESHGWPQAISAFMDALTREGPGCAVAVILSGFDADGVDALCRLQSAGGRDFVQAPETALYPDLPRSAILTGCVDRVLPPEGIVRELLQLSVKENGDRPQ